MHGPVPFYNRDLRKPVDEFMANLTPEQPYERANWGVTGACSPVLPACLTQVLAESRCLLGFCAC